MVVYECLVQTSFNQERGAFLLIGTVKIINFLKCYYKQFAFLLVS